MRTPGMPRCFCRNAKVLGCDVIGLQEMRRPGRIEFAAAVYRTFCSGEDGSSGQAGQHGVGRTVKESIVRKARRMQELTNERLMLMTFTLACNSSVIIFVVANSPTDTVSSTWEQKDAVWVDLDSDTSRVPSNDWLLVLIYANARTGVPNEDEECKVVGAYGRDTRASDRNGTRFCGLRVTTGLPSSTWSSPSPRDARLVHSTALGTRMGNVLTTSSRGNHTASLSETSLFNYSRVRIPTTTSCAAQSDSTADSLAIENSEPPQGPILLTNKQSRLTPTDANG